MYENLNNIKLKSSINRQDLLSLIDKHFESAVLKEEYDVIYIDPSLLITYNRLDLAITAGEKKPLKHPPIFGNK